MKLCIQTLLDGVDSHCQKNVFSFIVKTINIVQDLGSQKKKEMQVMNAVKGLLNRKDKLISIVIALKEIPALNQEIW